MAKKTDKSPTPHAGEPSNGALEAALRREIEVRKDMEARLLVAMEVAEAASDVKSEFLANVSHELRTPMTAIIASLQLLDDLIADPQQRVILDIATRSSETMVTLINNLLDFAKSETGKVKLEDNVFSIRQAVEESIKPRRRLAEERGLAFEYRVDLPADDMVVGDVARVRQILGHVLDNAIKFTQTGEVVCRVRRVDPNGHGLSVKPGRECLHFAVQDTGIGIPADKLSYVFEPFTQVDGSATRAHSGSGLGLAITRQLVDMMGGKIWVESELGAGTTCHFIIQLGLLTPSIDT